MLVTTGVSVIVVVSTGIYIPQEYGDIPQSSCNYYWNGDFLIANYLWLMLLK